MFSYLKNKNLLLDITICFTFWIGLTYCFLNIVHYVKISLGFNIVIAITILDIIVLSIYYWFFNQKIWKEILTSFCIIFISFFIASFFYDASYDGQMYHSEAMLKISENWNPIFEHFKEEAILDYVYNHYGKSAWYFGGYLYLLVGYFDSVKGINLVWMIMVIAASIYFVHLVSNNKVLSIIIGLAVGFNPVFLNLYLSNLIDLQLGASLILLIIYLLIYLLTNEKKLLLPIFLITIYLVNLKFTALVFVILLLFSLVLFFLLNKKLKEKKVLPIILVLAIASSVTLFGYHTYINNYKFHGHVFYPMYGKKDSTVTKAGMVEAMEYKTGNRVFNIVKSHFARTTFSESYTKPLKYKLPFLFNKYELERYAFAGVMIGGFGVWFSSVFLFSFLILLYLFLKKSFMHVQRKVIIYLVGAIGASVYIFPLWYIARYVPHYYLIPVIALYVAFHFRRKIIFYLLLFIMIVNLGSVMGYTYYNIMVISKRKIQLEKLKNNQSPVLVNYFNHRGVRVFFKDNGIKVRETDTFLKEFPLDTLYGSNVKYQIVRKI